jgi:hypothetical protein
MDKEPYVKLVHFLGALALTPLLVSAMPASAKVGGVYPLTHGIYVRTDTKCQGAPNAALRTYDGAGIGDPHSHACRVHVLSRQGRRYSVTQSCIDAGVGLGPRVSERQTVTVLNPTSFTVATEGQGFGYRYCPAGL